MSITVACGCVSISIDVKRHEKSLVTGVVATESLLTQLLKRFDDFQMPATWALADPVTMWEVAQIAATAQQEISMLADGSLFSNSQRPRFDFMQSIIRPLQMAADLQRPISTMSMSEPWQPQHVDLLIKTGVTMVRSPRRFSSVQGSGDLQTVCYGLTHVGVTATVSGGSWLTARAATRAIHEAATSGGFCHLRIDLASITRSDSSAVLQTVDRLLAQLDGLHISGRIAIENLGQIAARLQRKRNSAPARSILRAA